MERSAKVLRFCTIAGKMELVTSAGQSSKSHALKSVVDLEVSKTHLDTLTFIP
jgi:hypothetical protein